MKTVKIVASILDFPRKTLSEDIWQYSTQNKTDELPQLKPSVKFLITSTAQKYLSQIGLTLSACNLYGGSASYQWSEGADIDVSIYAENWPESISESDLENYQNIFKEIETPYKSFEIHFFLKEPHETVHEVADAVYDVLNDHWVLPPLILPEHFDPDEYFKPFLKAAESKAKKFDEAIGKLQRAWSTMSKASEAKENAAEPSLVQERIDIEKQTIRDITKWLSCSFLAIRDKRYAMHDALREKMEKDSSIGRFERFQEPEIIWKYLDRAGYNDFLWKIHKLYSDNRLEKILTTY